MSLYQKAQFLLSAAEIKQLPKDEGIEIAIVGRSNAGKSSILNKLTQQKHLARVSKTPGRTQLINVFTLDDTRRLIDLPGYGFAKVPDVTKKKWEKLLVNYLNKRTSLKGLLLIMDIRHTFRDQDYTMLEFANSINLPVHIILNKADKLSHNQINKVKEGVIKSMTQLSNAVSYQIFSAHSGKGLAELKMHLDGWYAE